MTDYYFAFDPDKNNVLQAKRGISFEQVITWIEADRIIDVRSHHNTDRYPHQYIIEVLGDDYVYLVPCIINKNEVFLKTIYPSRKAEKIFRKGRSDG